MVEPVGLVGTLIAIIQISSKVVSICYEYRKNTNDATREISQILDEVASVRNIVERLVEIADNEKSLVALPSLHTTIHENAALPNCLSELTLLKSQLKPEKGWRAKGRAMMWPLRQGQAYKYLEAIRRVKETLQLAMSADNTVNLIEILASTRILPLIQEDVSRLALELGRTENGALRKVLDWLAAPDLLPKHESKRQKHVQGTGQWFLEDEAYVLWKADPQSPLWLSGSSGCGKTVLCSTIIEDVRNERANDARVAIGYIYFDANGGQEFDAALMLRTLITQLMYQTCSLPSYLEKVYKKHTDLLQKTWRIGESKGRALGFNSYFATDVSLTEALMNVLRGMMNKLEHVYFVFNALDECKDDKLQQVLEVVEDISKERVGKTHLLACSRNLPEIQDCFGSLDATCIRFKTDQVDRDIQRAITAQFSQDSKMRKWPKALQQEVEVGLMSQAEGVFRWVECQLHDLRRCNTPRAIKQTLRTLPKSLDETYMKVLDNLDGYNIPMATKILQWLAFSERPLLLSEVAEALAIDVGAGNRPHYDPEQQCLDTREILSVCTSLVATTNPPLNAAKGHQSNSGVYVKLAHCSVKEFLTSTSIRSSACSAFALTEGLANSCLAKSCLAYMTHVNTPLLIDENPVYPLLDYAAKHWFLHMATSEINAESDDLQELIWDVFDPEKGHYSNWTKFHSIDMPWRASDLSGTSSIIPPLYSASYLGLDRICENLIQNGAAVDDSGGLLGSALQAAAFKGHLRIVRKLLDAGATPNLKGRAARTALAAAAFQGHEMVVKLLLERGANPNLPCSYSRQGQDPLFVAAERGHARICELLFDHGARDFWQMKILPNSALHAATMGGHSEIVHLILLRGRQNDDWPETHSLHESKDSAAELGHDDILQELRSYGISPEESLRHAAAVGDRTAVQETLNREAKFDTPGWVFNHPKALQSAARGGHADIVGDLLSHGADPSLDADDSTALNEAVIGGDIEIVRLLINAGASVHHGFYRPLSSAAKKGNLDILRYLVECGADVKANESEALEHAASGDHLTTMQELVRLGAELPTKRPNTTRLLLRAGSAQVVRYLIEHGVRPWIDLLESDKPNVSYLLSLLLIYGSTEVVLAFLDAGAYSDESLGATPLLYAVRHKQTSLVKALLAAQADPNKQSIIYRNQRKYPLLVAAENGDLEIARLLIAAGANVNQQDDEGFSALHGVAGYSQHDFLSKLIQEFGADLDVRLFNGSLPIHTAAARGNPECLHVLLAAGVNIDATNNDGRTPLHWAAENCEWANVNYLLDNGASTELKADGVLGLTPLDLAQINRKDGRTFRWRGKKLWSDDEIGALLARMEGTPA